MIDVTVNGAYRDMHFEELSKKAVGTILHERHEGPLMGMVMCCNASLCAYVGFPLGHPIARAHIDYDHLPIRVHGGLTFGQPGDGKHYPLGFFWYGWDYAHAGDYAFYDLRYPQWDHSGDHKWLLHEVRQDLEEAMPQFKRLYYYGWMTLFIRRKIARKVAW
jgi:hypothetical protein